MNKKKIIDYCLLRNRDISILKEDVMELLSKGWEPLGGVAASFDEDWLCCVQAMVKYEDI